MEKWGKISKQNVNKHTEQPCRWGFKPFICEMRHREYKSTLIDKGLNYLISVKLLILETIVSQLPWTNRQTDRQADRQTYSFSRHFEKYPENRETNEK